MHETSKIIVVENTPYLQVILDAAFSETGHDVSLASTANQCFDELAQCSAIFVDLLLEDMDGLSLIERIRLKNHSIPVIAFVAQTEIDSIGIEEAATRSMSEQSGANAVFFSPFNLGEIVNTTHRLLQNTIAEAV